MRPTAAVLLAAIAVGRGDGRRAQDYPSQDMRFLCAFPAGSGADVIVRYFAEKMRPLVKRTIIVENKPGAGGNIAAEAMVRSKPDGHTIFIHAGNTVAGNMHLIKKPPFDAAKAIQVAATINKQAFMLAVDAKRPWKTVAELTAYLKEKGDKATYAVSANSGIVMGAIYKEKAGLQAVQVHYRMAQDALNDMAERQGRLRAAGSGVCAEPAARGQAARAGGRIGGAAEIESGAADDDRSGRAHGPGRMVRRHGAERNAEADRRSAQQMVQRGRGERGDAELPEELRRRSLDQPRPRKDRRGWCADIAAWGDYIRIAKLEPQ